MTKSKKSGSARTLYTQRKVDTRDPLPRFLIVCEGERTEPNYFASFRVPRHVAEVDVRGTGYNTMRLVQEAIRLRGESDYDQVWCVFDRDDFPAQNFNNAISLAEREGMRVAYSNEAFELWYVLHFEFLHTGISRADYITRLKAKLGKYEKNSTDMYDLLEGKQDDAIKHAAQLLAEYDPQHPAEDNPSTTVHLLVEELRRYSR